MSSQMNARPNSAVSPFPGARPGPHVTSPAMPGTPAAPMGVAPVAPIRFATPAETEQPAHRVRAPMPSDSALGRKVRELRRSRGMTQKELAAIVGVTGAQLHRYETGATRVAASRMIAIAEALGVRADVLIGSCTPAAPVPPPTTDASTGDDLVELIQLFSSIGEPKNRNAVLAIARMLASSNTGPSNPGTGNPGTGNTGTGNTGTGGDSSS
jgi:transcriptional regulator with XRE-family HTH domain